MKYYVTMTLMAFLLAVSWSNDVHAATKTKKKSRTSYSYVKKGKKKKNRTASSEKRTIKHRRSGNGPDLRVLTTEKPNTEYSEVPDNGVNSVETKTGL